MIDQTQSNTRLQPATVDRLEVRDSATADIHAEKILVLDFGAQYSQLIARRVREADVYCELHPFDVSDQWIEDFAPRGIILSGGPESVFDAHNVRAPARVFELGVPVLGICYGMQTMAAQLGGQVESAGRREFGYAQVSVHGDNALLDGCRMRPVATARVCSTCG